MNSDSFCRLFLKNPVGTKKRTKGSDSMNHGRLHLFTLICIVLLIFPIVFSGLEICSSVLSISLYSGSSETVVAAVRTLVLHLTILICLVLSLVCLILNFTERTKRQPEIVRAVPEGTPPEDSADSEKEI